VLAFKGGFTLVELLVVIVLIGIVTAVILPEMRGTHGDAQLRAATRKILNLCALASSRAVTLNQDQVVRIQGENYFLESARKNKNGKSKEPERGKFTSKITVSILPIPQDDSNENEAQEPTSDSENSLKFFSDGTAEAKIIELKDRDGFVLKLRMIPTIARFRVSEISRE
jgi:type II secretion system protein H